MQELNSLQKQQKKSQQTNKKAYKSLGIKLGKRGKRFYGKTDQTKLKDIKKKLINEKIISMLILVIW